MGAGFALTLFSFFFFFQIYTNGVVLPPVWPDEVLFFEPASSWSTSFVWTTPSLSGLIPGMETKTLWMPPLYFIYSGSFLKWDLSSLVSIRLASAIAVYGTLILFTIWLYNQKISKPGILLAIASLVWEPMLYRFGVSARMESLTSFFYILSFVIALRPGRVYIFLSGFFLSCSILSHPFGASFGLIPIAVLISKQPKLWRETFGFLLLGGLIPLLFWMGMIHPDWELLVYQFGSQLERKKVLFGTFSTLDKLKIFFFGFGFSKIRAAFLLLYFLSFVYILWQKRFSISRTWLFFFLWMGSVLFALYSSSEGWYVYHFLFPMAFGIALLHDAHPFGKYFGILSVSISLLSLLTSNHLHWIQTNSDLILQNHFQKIEANLRGSKKLYLMAIPDPYFYLKENRPDMDMKEFIPGELGLPTETYWKTIQERDSFLFYNEDLIPKKIKEHLEKPGWKKMVWEIPVPKAHWLSTSAILYVKK